MHRLAFLCLMPLIIAASSCNDGSTEVEHVVLHQASIDDVTLDDVAILPDGSVVAVGGRSYDFGYFVKDARGWRVGPKRFFDIEAIDDDYIATGIDGYWFRVVGDSLQSIDRSPNYEPIRAFDLQAGQGLAVVGKSLSGGKILRLSADFATTLDTLLDHELLAVSTSCGGIVAGYGGIFRHDNRRWQYVQTPADFYTDLLVVDGTIWSVGLGGQVIKSTDCGATWSSVLQARGSLSDLPQLEAIDYADGRYVIAGNDIILSSTDGTDWQSWQTNKSYHFSGVAVGNETIYLTTYSGELIAVDWP